MVQQQKQSMHSLADLSIQVTTLKRAAGVQCPGLPICGIKICNFHSHQTQEPMTDQRLDQMNDYFQDRLLDAYERQQERVYEEMLNEEPPYEDEE